MRISLCVFVSLCFVLIIASFFQKTGGSLNQTVSPFFSMGAPRKKISREIFFWEAFP